MDYDFPKKIVSFNLHYTAVPHIRICQFLLKSLLAQFCFWRKLNFLLPYMANHPSATDGMPVLSHKKVIVGEVFPWDGFGAIWTSNIAITFSTRNFFRKLQKYWTQEDAFDTQKLRKRPRTTCEEFISNNIHFSSIWYEVRNGGDFAPKITNKRIRNFSLLENCNGVFSWTNS